MSNLKTIIVSLLFLVVGGIAGFFISQEFFPKFDYGYTEEGGIK